MQHKCKFCYYIDGNMLEGCGIQTDKGDPDWHFIPNMLNWVHVWTPSWLVHDLNILLVQKGCHVTCYMGQGIILDIHTVTSKHPRRTWQHLIPQYLDVRCRFMAPSTTTSSLLAPWWIAPYTMTDGPRFLSLGWTQASISLSPYLWCLFIVIGARHYCHCSTGAGR